MSKILVTGASGFIGFHVCNALLEKGESVVGLDNFNNYYDQTLKEDRNKILEGHASHNFKLYRGDLSDVNIIKKVFIENEIEKVCHLAAQAGVRYSITNPQVYIQSNLVGFANLIEEVKNAGIKTFVFASSSSVYGNNKKMPFSVEDRVDSPVSLYAATKKANESIAFSYHHLFGLKCTGLRFFTVYGPWGRPDMACFLFTKAILAGEPIKVFNYGKMKRDFTYIDDIVCGTIRSLEKSYDWEIFNLGNNHAVELNYFIQCLENELGKKAIKQFLPIQNGDVPESYADIEKSKQLLDFEPKININEGLKLFINWYKNYYHL